jgi:hypothetical protein
MDIEINLPFYLGIDVIERETTPFASLNTNVKLKNAGMFTEQTFEFHGLRFEQAVWDAFVRAVLWSRYNSFESAVLEDMSAYFRLSLTPEHPGRRVKYTISFQDPSAGGGKLNLQFESRLTAEEAAMFASGFLEFQTANEPACEPA